MSGDFYKNVGSKLLANVVTLYGQALFQMCLKLVKVTALASESLSCTQAIQLLNATKT